VPAELVTRLLAACDLSTPLGTRDYAIVLTMWRMGLRNGEVAFLSLDDINWDAGEVMVHGKGSRNDKLPLPADVGQALADYLVRARPRWGSERMLFLIHRAPYSGLSRSAVVSVVAAACDRAGQPAPAAAFSCQRHPGRRRGAGGGGPASAPPGPEHNRDLRQARLPRSG
jgi:integrase/recombinase XerD